MSPPRPTALVNRCENQGAADEEPNITGDAFHLNPPGTPTRSGTVAQLAVQWETTPREILIPPHGVKDGEDKTYFFSTPILAIVRA